MKRDMWNVWKRCGKRGAPLIGFLAVALFATSNARAAKVVPEWAVAILPSGAEYRLELAVSDEERARGYMFREKIGEREGMMFFFDEPGPHGFWMKNCLVPLDIVWIDGDLRVVHIAEAAPPCPASGACPSIAPLRAATYVLEFAAGTARAQGLDVGDRVVILSDVGLQ